MRLKGNISTAKVDIMMYHGLYDLASNKIQKIDEELIPTFIIEEALMYFCELEKYEICHQIKQFFQNNPSFVIESTRLDWFGIPARKNKQKQ